MPQKNHFWFHKEPFSQRFITFWPFYNLKRVLSPQRAFCETERFLMEPFRQKCSSMASWSTFIFKLTLASEATHWLIILLLSTAGRSEWARAGVVPDGGGCSGLWSGPRSSVPHCSGCVCGVSEDSWLRPMGEAFTWCSVCGFQLRLVDLHV